MRLNLGCGRFPLEGYINVDAHEPADFQCDVWDICHADLDEVRMDHFLEHIPHTRTLELLQRVHSWLKPEGLLLVEVPDLEAIVRGRYDDWQRYIYGSQQHEGEYHRAGFTPGMLSRQLNLAGFGLENMVRFKSEFSTRKGMPCLSARAYA